MLYLTCIMIPNVDLALYGVLVLNIWVSGKCAATIFVIGPSFLNCTFHVICLSHVLFSLLPIISVLYCHCTFIVLCSFGAFLMMK